MRRSARGRSHWAHFQSGVGGGEASAEAAAAEAVAAEAAAAEAAAAEAATAEAAAAEAAAAEAAAAAAVAQVVAAAKRTGADDGRATAMMQGGIGFQVV